MASPRIAADADGHLTVAWITQRPGFTDGVTAATQTHTGWSHPVRLSKDLKVARYPQDGKGAWGADTVRLAVTPKGAATVAWNWGSEARNKPWRIQAVFHRPGGRWGGVAHVTRPPEPISSTWASPGTGPPHSCQPGGPWDTHNR